jgi:signal transduction histidine kinase
MMLINLLPSFICLVFFDVLHRPFGISFHQFGYDEPNFHILDAMIASAYLTVIGFLLNQRRVSDQFEDALYDKQEKLEEKNKELSHMNAFINEQNYEMNTQSEELIQSHEALLEAHYTIESQKKLLEEQNRSLEEQVEEKTRDLSMVNEELLIRNNELRQFSHTLSHNLKSPVATFQGLLNLVDKRDLNESNRELLQYLNESVCKMQQVFSDMNQMLEIRNKLYKSIETVDLQALLDDLHNHFYTELRNNKIDFSYDFNGLKTIRTNHQQINSILYNLISNAIKFRSEKRRPEIDIEIIPNGAYHSFVVKDNGVGIDLEKYSKKLFFPYQQFHNQASGKGLGLYLVRLQAESLGGSVKLCSEPDRYTKVEVKLRK